MMALYQKEGAIRWAAAANVVAHASFSSSYCITESVELRQAPFIFWINDLAAMDPYFILPR